MENKETGAKSFSIKKLYSEHKKPFIAITALVLVIAITLGCVLPAVLSGKNNNGNDNGGNNTPGGTIVGGGGSTTNNGETEYTVQVVTVGGMPLEGVMVYIHNGEGYSVCTAPKETDENGIAKFTLKTSNDYSVQVDGVPKGYNVRDGFTKDERYPLSAQGTVIRLSSSPVTTGGLEDTYELGDVMYDFTLTDINGEEYKLSTLLETKDMVMLNFWYVECPNCAYEFPYINRVYQDYKDDIAILAINDYPDDVEADLRDYESYLKGYYGVLDENETLDIPLFKVGNGDDDLKLDRFPGGDQTGYPTTVIIDRYGVITMIEVGAVLGESKWINVFDYFVGDDYKQVLIDNPEMLNPKIEPTIQWTDTSASEIADAFNSGDITVNYYPETEGVDAKYSWPFIVDTFNGETVVRPSNSGIDGSYSILYAEVSLKPGQAVMFDWFASTQNNNIGQDVLYILVDGKDIYSISGMSEGEYETCCTYVDPRPVTQSNKDDIATYVVAFAYYKDDAESLGDDTVYLKNLRVVDATEIPVETYIFRYAATDLNDTRDGYNTYVEVYLGSDGYYHVGSADGPLLLANHLSYTQFDPYKTVSERLYENYELMVNGVNMFNNWVIYGNAAVNSQMSYYTPVTEELRTMLETYCNIYRLAVGKAASENLWLQLCVYFDAYGKDKDGNPTKHLADPIQGLTAFSAIELEIEKTPEKEGDIIASAEVTYNKVIMPKGYLFKFVPEVSGVYRVNSHSATEVVGWIFIGTNEEWAAAGGDRTILTHYDVGERYCPDLLIDPDGDGVYERDYNNISLAAYMEAGKEYYIDVAYYDTYETGTFTFDVAWVSETFGHFIQASNGPITYIESTDGSMGQLIAAGIEYTFVEEDGVEYAYQVRGYDKNGNPILGEKIYVDFYYPTTLFQSQSIMALIKANAFNYLITETDREALIILDEIRLDTKFLIINRLIQNGTVADETAGEALWNEKSYNDMVKDYYDGKFDGEYSETDKALVADAFDAVVSARKESMGLSEWNYYQMDDIMNGIYHNTDNRTDKDITAQGYLDIYYNEGKEALKAYWDSAFDSIVPAADAGVTDVSEWRFNYFWDYYKMDDVSQDIFHGNLVDYTDAILSYVEKMENDTENHPERQGCVAATRELAEILDTLIAREVFEDVKDGWLKFCYYYDLLGVPVE